MGKFIVRADDPAAADVRALLETHLAFALRHSPPEDVHALDVSDLLAESVSFFSIRDDGNLVGVGALKELDPAHGEIKSMHTCETARRRGVGRTMVEYLLALARARGYRRVSLETGSMAAFAPARALYVSVGFETCPPFAGYGPSPNSICMTLALDSPAR
jgi:putative acetyltransferase